MRPVTPTHPAGREARLAPIRNANTRNATGRCLEVHDIAVARYIANRAKDHRYSRAWWRHGLIEVRTFGDRLAATNIEKSRRSLVRSAAERHRGETRRD